MNATFLAGRILFGGFFLYNGINHFIGRRHLSQHAAAKKVPAPDAMVTMAGILLLFGGASIVLGVKPKLGAAAIIKFLLGVSPAMHDFWNEEDPNRRMTEMVNFSKNMALLGAALALASVPEPWSASVSLGYGNGTPERALARMREQGDWVPVGL
jgi:uncharacterized membrane protein YphA (DoxX/SURF4 family)